ncbi:T5orf172 domain-containing protein [Pseudorhodobacter antarcticus]|uniref:T5orf172 domain-containing protein n=1 Tax=Pseudorhodobacter antarcticus TaxID=1077947 RepID=A0A1H8KXR3_9RHOB|nr:GIY-YIG nuclease family protein [Pseudorhodobacter antarcticus]SEN97386.1 T5orf172 domain-containing protein [Pseudorhodobacter antarcticus]
MAVVYVLTNPAFENYVKVGKTTNLVQRLRQLDNTSVPLPFRCVYAVEVDDDSEVERLVHQAFADHRTRTTREFFEIDPQRVIAALKLTRGRDVTPKGDIAEDEEGVKALEKATRKPRKIYKLSDAGLKVGDIINYANNSQICAQVINEKKIFFEGQETSLSKSALTLLQRDGYTWQTVNGWQYWTYEGETIAERLERVLEDSEANEAGDEE